MQPEFRTNRDFCPAYMFAWVVATDAPQLHADDVDKDLVLIAQRALDKDWRRRSQLRLEDFLADTNIQQDHALQVLGLAVPRNSLRDSDNIALRLERVREVASELEQAVVKHLRVKGITAKHSLKAGSIDTSKLVLFRWDAPPIKVGNTAPQIELLLDLRLLVRQTGHYFELSISLAMKLDDDDRKVGVSMPELKDEEAIGLHLLDQTIEAIKTLAVGITSGDVGKEEA